MKNLIYFVLLFIVVTACGPDVEGELRGVKNRGAYYPEDVFGDSKLPFGMVYIPSGAYQTGDNDEDIMQAHTTSNRTISVPAFYMDASEISNNEYRQFVHWVRDSIAREKLYRRNEGEDAREWVNIPDPFFKEPFRSIISNGSDVKGGNSQFDPYVSEEVLDDNLFKALYGDKWEKDEGDRLKSTDKTNKNDRSKILDELTLSDGAVDTIFMSYSSDVEEIKKGKKTTFTNGGRKENRKYFTLNWETPVKYEDPATAFLLSDMYYSESEQFYNRKEIDTRLLVFDYYWIDYKEAAKRGKINATGITENNFNFGTRKGAERREPLGRDDKIDDHRTMLDKNGQVWSDVTSKKVEDTDEYEDPEEPDTNRNSSSGYAETILKNPGQDLDLGYSNSKGQHNAIRGHTDRQRFIIKEKINVYPDTLVWLRDHTYACYDDMAKSYFYSNAYDNYPVVGITWPQAKAFSVWRSQIFNTWLQSNEQMFVNDFRLPSESEWERAARGDMDMMAYPWGGPYIRNYSGCHQANFKPTRGSYFEDGGMRTVKVYSYNPNMFGLYCMAGNVAEWCSTSFDESLYDFQHDMSAEYDYQALDGDPVEKKRKVVRGGSWKDIGYYLQNNTRSYEYQDSAKAYIGFRNVMTHLGRGGKEIDKENGEEIQSDIQLK